MLQAHASPSCTSNSDVHRVFATLLRAHQPMDLYCRRYMNFSFYRDKNTIKLQLPSALLVLEGIEKPKIWLGVWVRYALGQPAAVTYRSVKILKQRYYHFRSLKTLFWSVCYKHHHFTQFNKVKRTFHEVLRKTAEREDEVLILPPGLSVWDFLMRLISMAQQLLLIKVWWWEI